MVIGFYRQTEEYGCFSNFYRAPFEVDGVKYLWAEQYIMRQKALLFDDNQIAYAVLRASNPPEAKRLGRQVHRYDDALWSARRRELCTQGIYEKFKQNEDIKQILLGTGDAILAECSPTDRIWGIGLRVGDFRVQDPDMWCGFNLLGSILMDVRQMLREEA